VVNEAKSLKHLLELKINENEEWRKKYDELEHIHNLKC
jgi:hypothetical protein